MVQDYHLTLTAAMLRERGPTCASAHFIAHAVGAAGLLPAAARRRRGARCWRASSAPTARASSPARWAEAFADCCETVLGARVEPAARRVRSRTRAGPPARRARAGRRRRRRCGSGRTEPDVESHMAALREQVGDRAGSSCASTAPSCRRTSCAACWPTASCWPPTRVARARGAPGVRLSQPARPARIPRVHRRGAALRAGDRRRVRHRRTGSR